MTDTKNIMALINGVLELCETRHVNEDMLLARMERRFGSAEMNHIIGLITAAPRLAKALKVAVEALEGYGNKEHWKHQGLDYSGIARKYLEEISKIVGGE